MEDTRQRILHAAHTIFSAEGFRGATTRRIAVEAGVNEVTIFRLFSTKEDLLGAAVDHATAATIQRLRETALPAEPSDVAAELRERMLVVLHAFAHAAPQVRTALAEWGRHPGIDERRLATSRYLHDELLRYMRTAINKRLLRPGISPETATAMVIAPLFAHGLLSPMIPAVFDSDLEPAVDAYLEVVLNGLLPGAPGASS